MKRTYENDLEYIDSPEDIETLVVDKRSNWRASPSKAKRRQRRYKKRIAHQILRENIWKIDNFPNHFIILLIL